LKGLIMNVTNEDAVQSLAQVEDIMAKTRQSLVSTYAGPFLILWGIIWIVSFLGTQFYLAWADWIWNISSGLGIIGTIFVGWRQHGRGPATRDSSDKRFLLRTILFWPLIITYVFVWLSIVKPGNGIELNAFMISIMMFAYVVIGLWFGSWLMVILGIVVTAFTLIGFHLVPAEYYCLWMAVTAGGGLFGTGLYMKLRWR
jgi:hypothetical protein